MNIEKINFFEDKTYKFKTTTLNIVGNGVMRDIEERQVFFAGENVEKVSLNEIKNIEKFLNV